MYFKIRGVRMKNSVRIIVICVRGYGVMDNVTFFVYVYMDLFFDVVNYLVRY